MELPATGNTGILMWNGMDAYYKTNSAVDETHV